MFTSTGNNFGGGPVVFKDVQESNYLVLNAVVKADSDGTAYLAAEQLEIYVPDLAIDRSVACGVVCQYKERGESGGYPYVYDAGTILKSWISDRNTIVIEKLPEFDHKGELTIWILALYCQLNQGGNTIRGSKTYLSFSDPNSYTSWDYESFCSIFEHWVFVYAKISYVSWDGSKYDWAVDIQGLPSDVAAEVPIMMGASYGNDNLGGVNPCRIEAGVFSMKAKDRSSGFSNSSSEPFIFAYLVREGE